MAPLSRFSPPGTQSTSGRPISTQPRSLFDHLSLTNHRLYSSHVSKQTYLPYAYGPRYAKNTRHKCLTPVARRRLAKTRTPFLFTQAEGDWDKSPSFSPVASSLVDTSTVNTEKWSHSLLRLIPAPRDCGESYVALTTGNCPSNHRQQKLRSCCL